MIKYFGTGQPVRIWCQDESRFGLITMQGKMITLKGIKPIGKKQSLARKLLSLWSCRTINR
ncbi:MAG: hypothetical protein EAZ19_00860 [Oscillatoriales cyanobacterium]|nr:MAG: hypothetical protein EAZ94_02740 [Oscillatoriales cyanobacterium]TAE20770.1 MAG: hypothetical protein EAZ93_22350 [Oscillatoriales cyanobacterium]TAE71132.1 MAG: hypothetical protein EAZ86_03820 [Oscillatoriales cyanobacterium]TAF91590.1 MAG: hypothetical protein EAZ49_05085 [Oscillatoriales cyanobacterium]TAG59162.1 MAG: hypothetical protein EAZ28_12440 [Oscillatoriales cyanobacterium]